MSFHLTCQQIYKAVKKAYPKTNITEKQIYAYWVHLNEATWRLDDDQVKSALKVLERAEGIDVEIIPIRNEPGISTIAFGFKDILDDYGKEIKEIAMDLTCMCPWLFL